MFDTTLPPAAERVLANYPTAIAEAARRDLANAPKMSTDQRDRIAALLRGGAAA